MISDDYANTVNNAFTLAIRAENEDAIQALLDSGVYDKKAKSIGVCPITDELRTRDYDQISQKLPNYEIITDKIRQYEEQNGLNR